MPDTTRETLRIADQLMIATLRAPYKLSQPERPLPKGRPDDWEQRKVLPPFLGELGFEVRYFLASVEPWLRSGWRIPARRPELYLPGAAFSDPALFDDLNALLDEAGAKPLANSFDLLGRIPTGMAISANLSQSPAVSVNVQLPGAAEITHTVRVALLEQELRRCFARHHIHQSRPVTPWDVLLTSAFRAHPEQLCGGSIALAPAYKPDAFLNPEPPTYPHVGVQFRSISYKPDTNSDIAQMHADAAAAAAALGLPLLVYGHPDGTVRPDGLVCTQTLAGGDLLRFELGMLSACTVMFSPSSGWCDLMCWLQVPTILEKLTRPQVFTCNGVFRPRVMLRNPALPVAEQVEQLLRTPEMLPLAPENPDVYDDTDWDGTWIAQGMQEFIGPR